MSSKFQAGPGEPEQPVVEYGPYRVERVVERYGQLSVCIARHKISQQTALLTVFEPDSIAAAQVWTERLKAIRWLQHEHILVATEGGITSGTLGGEQYALTPLVPPLMRQDRSLSPQATLDMARQIVAALDFAHGQGIVHGMIRPPHVGQVEPGRIALRGWELAGSKDEQALQALRPADDIALLARVVHRALTGQEMSGNNFSPRLPDALAAPLRNALPGGKGYESARAFQAALIQAIGSLPAAARGQGLDSPRRPAIAPQREKHPPTSRTQAGHKEPPTQKEPLNHPATREGRRAAILLFLLVIVIVAVGIAFVLLRQGDPNIAARLNLGGSACPTCEQENATLTATPSTVAQVAVTSVPVSMVALAALPSPTATATVNSTAVFDSSDATSIPSLTPVPQPTDTDTPPPGVVTATTAPFTPGPTATDTDTPPPSPTATLTPTPLPPKPCISLVGDSVTHGGFTYEIPDVGYIVGLTHPLAEFVNTQMRNQGLNDLIAYDRGASNMGINSTNHGSYYKTQAYGNLLQDHCKFTVIMPWYNDITPGNIPQTDAAPQHVRAIINLVTGLTEINPQGRILVMNYFQGNVAPFAANTWARGFTPDNRDLYNHEIKLSCDLGSLSKMPQVSCWNTDDAFQGMGTSYVIGLIGRSELMSNMVAPLNDVQQGWLDDYFSQNPGGLLQGDGIHLSTTGKIALANYLIQVVQKLGDGPIPTAGP